jgi:predicted Zn-dependent protease
MKKILAAAALAFVLSAAVAGTASAAPRLEGARWTCAPIAVSVNLSGLTGTQQRDALAAVRVAAHAVAAAHAVRTVTQTLRTPSAYAYGRELRGTITHELGYAFGLAHSADPLDVRSTTWTKGQRTAFTASELRILAARYAGCGQT